MKTSRDTFTDLDRGMPGWFIFSAWFLPVGILGQFLSAGSALFHDSGLWGLHVAAGGILVLPAIALLVGALSVPRLRGFGWWASLIFIIYLIQVALAVETMPLLLSVHPFNGALLLSASLVLLAKVERRRAQALSMETFQ
ncbi:DUF6220 domain-containing protein [Paracoccus alkanivorans]|uniref:Uncharacterized protein n=1 Tax=Paracoccus alkanivorans TaxID=2116655 RepID=A0A3M0ME93_9RHOB|nr:DUF6220 domain-containing protein [Paracoccus alkanivorans]RMC33920.1 hypothetical protein C9E81_16690 [Paracoccus alkanivorans]